MKTNSNSVTPIEELVDALTANLRNLQHDHLYSLEQLVGSDFWQAIPKRKRNHLGSTFKARAKAGDLAVIWCDRGTDNIQRYRLK